MIVGAVHIPQHLAAMAAQTGFQVVVVDPRAVLPANNGLALKLIFTWTGHLTIWQTIIWIRQPPLSH